jgi:hypothetical protein
MKVTPEQMLLESAKTLGEAAIIVGGAPVDMQMTLETFILSYGRNGVIFTVSPNAERP